MNMSLIIGKNSYHYINCEDLKESLGINETIKFCTRGYGISIEDTLVFLWNMY